VQNDVAAFLPGDTHRELRLQTNYSKESSDLILLPIFLLSYRYQNKVYRFLVNGQTGKVAGDKPISHGRIAAAIGVGLALVVGFFILLALLGML
jgi:hypothetical protein